MEHDTTPRLLDRYELADRLGISASKVRELTAAGRIPAYRISARIDRFDLEEVRHALRSERQQPPGAEEARR